MILQNHIVALVNLNDGNTSAQTPECVFSIHAFPNCSDLSDIFSVKQMIYNKIVQKNIVRLDVSFLDEESFHSTIDSCQNKDKLACYLFIE